MPTTSPCQNLVIVGAIRNILDMNCSFCEQSMKIGIPIEKKMLFHVEVDTKQNFSLFGGHLGFKNGCRFIKMFKQLWVISVIG